MSDYIKVEDSFVEALLEQAAWDVARVGISEKKDKKGKKGDKGAGKDKKDKPDFTTDDREGDKSTTHAGDDFEGCESVEAHTCPLCESPLEEELTDEKVYEHIAQIRYALQSIEEEDEDLDEDNTRGPEQFGGGVVDDDDPVRKKAMARAKALSQKGMADAEAKKKKGDVDEAPLTPAERASLEKQEKAQDELESGSPDWPNPRSPEQKAKDSAEDEKKGIHKAGSGKGFTKLHASKKKKAKASS
tara:strand:- start:332 stop:1066 length:735 start_codon:yes stop_codon:yes gene_type:complete